jgi:hypothetical protein
MVEVHRGCVSVQRAKLWWRFIEGVSLCREQNYGGGLERNKQPHFGQFRRECRLEEGRTRAYHVFTIMPSGSENVFTMSIALLLIFL